MNLLLDMRNRSTGWQAEQWHSVLVLACQVRDERAALGREVDAAANPFRVVRPMTAAELAESDDDDV